MSANFVSLICAFNWPYNLEELYYTIEFAIANLGDSEILEVLHLPISFRTFEAEGQQSGLTRNEKSILKSLNSKKTQIISYDTIEYEEKNDLVPNNTVQNISINDNSIQASKENDKYKTRAICYFYPDGELWRIGTENNNGSYDNYIGFKFLYYILHYPEKMLYSSDVYERNKKNDKNKNIIIENIIKFEPYRLPELEDEELRYKSIGEIYDFIEKLEKSQLTNPEDETIRKETIELAKQQLKYRKDNKNYKRTNVTRAIREVIEKITNENNCPEMKDYLNRETIKTGGTLMYRPVPSKTPDWIFDKSELPHKKS